MCMLTSLTARLPLALQSHRRACRALRQRVGRPAKEAAGLGERVMDLGPVLNRAREVV